MQQVPSDDIKDIGNMQTSDHKPFLICKGADSVIEALLNFSQGNEQRELFDETNKHVVKFAQEGLRTLFYAKRELSWEELNDWLEKKA